ncbi:tail fiber domain-containing protein [Vibrio fluvialis]|uniref:tail fiber domain-containing protein n=1 Tax=Vibrio fluvialis TaxID=676 RepID=UPI001F1B445A|nr:tail fiber domain-containing protein [Vibrio fluvialis]MCE7642285.1 tail fiber domain-containing protein [Vibrio fluvialis]
MSKVFDGANDLLGSSGAGGILGIAHDPGDFLGAQATRNAAETSADLGYKTLGMQQDWLNYIKNQFEPYSEAGQKALGQQMGQLSTLKSLSNSEYPTFDAAPSYADLANSQEFKDLNNQAQYSLLNASEATGGLGSTATGNALGASTANVLSNLYGQKYAENVDQYNADVAARNDLYSRNLDYFNALGAISGRGLQGSQGLGSFGGDTLSGMASTMSGIGTGALNAAANQTQMGAGLLSAAGGILSAFSDIRLKRNVKATGEYTERGNEIYTWDWNEKAEKLGLVGSGRGVIADHAEQVTPAAVSTDKSGYKVVDYARV